MHVTVESLGDVELTARATVADVTALARAHGLVPPDHWWCGSRRLDPRHRAGIAPLVDGAHLSSEPGPLTWTPPGLHLAVVAGPDSGTLVEVGAKPVVLGRSSVAERPFTGLTDPTLSASHALFDPRTSTVSDLGSTNGTTVESSSLPRARQPWTPGQRARLGHSIVELRLPGGQPTDPDSPAASRTFSWPGALASVMGAGMMAALTGRWWFVLVGAIYPLMSGAKALGSVLQRAQPFPETCDPTGTGTCPVVPREPLAIQGDPHAAADFARAVMVARGTGCRGWDEPWVRWLPEGPDIEVILPGQEIPSWALATAAVSETGVTITSRTGVRHLPPTGLSTALADACARRIYGAREHTPLPRHVRWADVRVHPDGPRPLRAAVGTAANGPFTISLRDDGPHFLVAGTTGSGKSALLETLVLSLAHDHSPADLSLVLVDFKGGAGLRRCLDLPHVVGTLTDLDPALAGRVLSALRHELHRRKTSIAAAGYASWDDWESAATAPPRLLVVIDEYQEMMARYRDFVPHITTLAAQGRSLGMHIVLSTQRPAGAVTPDVRANVATAIALRMASPSESHDVVGDSSAAALDPAVPGRGIVATGTSRTMIHVALPSAAPTPAARVVGHELPPGPHLSEVVMQAWRDHPRQPPLVLEPLQDMHPLSCDPPSIRIGWADLPDTCAQEWLTWDPSSGLLAACGPAGSGRTSLLRAIATQAAAAGWTPVWLPDDPREAARTLHRFAATDRAVLLLDNAATTWTALERTDRGEAAEALNRLLTSGAPVACTFGPGAPLRWVSHASTVVAFHGLHPTDAASWSVPRELHSADVRPGRAVIGRHGRWAVAQVPWTDDDERCRLVEPLPTVADALPSPFLGIGGDQAEPLALSPGERVTVVGPPGTARDRLSRWVGSRHNGPVDSCDSLVAARARGALDGAVILTEPHVRDVTDAVGHPVPGVVDPSPVRDRVVLVREGTAQALQLPPRDQREKSSGPQRLA